MRIPQVTLQYISKIGRLGGFSVLAVMLCSLPANATDLVVPWECTGFKGEAQSRCVRIYADLQQEKIEKLERDLEIQRQTVHQLQRQVTQQASVTAGLERKLNKKRFRWYGGPSFQFYPSLGLSLGLGRHRHFGGSLFLGRPYYYGPRFFGYGYRRGYRH